MNSEQTGQFPEGQSQPDGFSPIQRSSDSSSVPPTPPVPGMPANAAPGSGLDEDTAPRPAITRPMTKLRLTKMDSTPTEGSAASASQPATNQQQVPFSAAAEQMTPPPSYEQFNNFEAASSGAPYQEVAYREHVTGQFPAYPGAIPQAHLPYPNYQAATPLPQPTQPAPPVAPTYPSASYPVQTGQPAYPPYQGPPGYPPYAGYPGYPTYSPYAAGYPAYYGYPGYPPYAYPIQPPQPKRDRYQLVIAIISFIGSILALGAGLLSVVFLLLVWLASVVTPGRVNAQQEFAGVMLFIAFALAGLVGGGFSLYHSIRALFLKKPSSDFKLPWFSIFLLVYLIVIGIATGLYFGGLALAYPALNVLLILLAAAAPALTFLALGLRRIHFPRNASWPTSWRRFTLSIVSGATLGIVLALIFEFVLSATLARQLGLKGLSLDNPDQPIPTDLNSLIFLFLIVSVVAPLVEEAVKPLAVVAYIGRIRSAGEAFILGMASGIGFDLVETIGYISSGYKDWLNIALQRSTAGLLHGFGAGMIALGWYLLTHRDAAKHRNLLAIGCFVYAILQHAFWNGSSGLQLLPAPLGPYLDSGTVSLGSITIPSFMLVYIVESLLMLIFFLFVTKRLRTKAPLPPSSQAAQKEISVAQPQIVARTGL